MKQLLRQPLLQFLVVGATLFLLVELLREDEGPGDARIEVPPERIEALAGGFARTWSRPPTRPELEAVVEEWVREEVLYREALARGLDRGDIVVRRRLRQKLESIALDVADWLEPTDAELSGFLASQADRFRREPHVALKQVFVDPSREGSPDERARALLAELTELGTDADVEELGDRLMLPTTLELDRLSAIARVFGTEFADAVNQLEPGSWRGPVRSGYGLHLVVVTEREESVLPPLAQVRADVERTWRAARREELADAFYAALRARYDVSVKWPEAER